MTVKGFIARVRRQLIGPDPAATRRRHESPQRELAEQQRNLRVALGVLMARNISGTASSCNDAEFQVFSQFGEDGIIEYLIQRCEISPSSFVEIGVERYVEANTRFLVEHRLWRGLLVDQNPHLVDDLARTNLHWRSQVRAVSAFVTRDNVREIVEPFVGTGGLGLLSVDIDGVDYWILDRLVDFDPALVIVEYNALYGDTAAVSVPYDAAFDRTRPEFHNIYYGASLAAFDQLLAARGYALVACTAAGNNAFFVRHGHLAEVPARSVSEAYRPPRFVEHRALDGSLTGIADRTAQLRDIERLPLVEVTTGRSLTVGEILSD